MKHSQIMCLESEVVTVVNMKIRSSVMSGHVVIWYLAILDCIIRENEVCEADKIWMQRILSVKNTIWALWCIVCTIKNYDTKQLNVYKQSTTYWSLFDNPITLHMKVIT